MFDYFFSGNQYIRVTRGNVGPGQVDPGYPEPISNWGWGGFGANGIDAALYSGSKCYFFSGNQYIRVTRNGNVGPGQVDPGYPRPISVWGWGAFGANGIDGALWSGSKCYFFSGNQYIRVTRGETGPGTVDPGYPRPISVWGWGAFGANGIDGALWSGSKCYFFSGNRYIRVTRGETGPGTVDPGYPAPISNWNWRSFGANGINAALYSGGPFALAPAAGLGSNSNYLLYSAGAQSGTCNNLTGVSVTINVDTDITGSNGFGFQLNAYSAKGDYDAAQQYIIYLSPSSQPPQLTCMIDNWKSDGSTQLVNEQVKLATLSSHTLPTGYQLTISLENDASGNITGATYAVIDNRGSTLGSQTLSVTPSTNQAPIVAFQLNFVGYLNKANTTLSSGAGTITYTASELLTALSTEPACVDWDYVTLETANSSYGLLPAIPSQTFTQYYQPSAEGAVIRKTAAVRHITSVQGK